jgi:hypothetical protein
MWDELPIGSLPPKTSRDLSETLAAPQFPISHTSCEKRMNMIANDTSALNPQRTQGERMMETAAHTQTRDPPFSPQRAIAS